MADPYLEPLIIRHRPRSFNEVFGNDETVDALYRRVNQAGQPHSYLFGGPSGVGKTTLARLVADKLGAEVNEVHAAIYNGVDAMRNLVEISRHQSMMGSGRRMIIMNEVQRLSRNAWDALLEVLEEPPDHAFFALTTTEPARVPDAVQTRCYRIDLNTLRRAEMSALIIHIIKLEGWQVPNNVLDLLLTAATGQPRKALALLDKVHDVTDVREAERIVQLDEVGEPVLQLARQLLSGRSSWMQVREMLQQIMDDGDTDFDAARIQLARYIGAVIVRSEKEPAAKRAWILLDSLIAPVQTYDSRSIFLGAIGRAIWLDYTGGQSSAG